MLLRYSLAILRVQRTGRLAALACLALVALPPGTVWAHATHDARVAAINAKLALNPDDPQLCFDLAETNIEHGDWQIGLFNLERVDALAPGAFLTDLSRAQALLIGEQPAEARLVLDRFIAAHPKIGAGWLQRARALAKLGLGDASLADYRAGLERIPNAEPELVQEVAEALVARHHVNEAADLIDAHLQRLGHSPGLVQTALELEISLGRYEAALGRVEAMQKSAPRPEPWMAKRAWVLAQAGRTDDSIAAWKTLIAHLRALPESERGAHSMLLLAEQAQLALAASSGPSLTTARPTHP